MQELTAVLCRDAQDSGEFAQAFWLCAQSCQWLSELSQLNVAGGMTAHVNQLYEETTRWLEAGLQAVCADFHSDRLQKVSPISFMNLSTCIETLV